MNRQSKRADLIHWANRGAMSFADAAIAEAELWFDDDDREIVVQVRDEADPELVRTLTVRREDRFIVSGLRGGVRLFEVGFITRGNVDGIDNSAT